MRGAQVYSTRIPLTPGPLVVALKVGSNQDPTNESAFWPPNEPDQIETIAASYTPPTPGGRSVRLFNLSPTTKAAGMTSSSGGAFIAGIPYGASSKWKSFHAGPQVFTFVDDSHGSSSQLYVSPSETPPAPPIGSTQFLIGLQGRPAKPIDPTLSVSAVLLDDAPEGGVCKPQ